ncbi:MAG TPA: glycosyltransferase [Isosphaeraceae bacterium]|nr:glycosyltransferase [Isosphaeraceae bacterium]
MTPVKVLHVFGCMQHGGAEMRTVDVMCHIDRERFSFHYATLSGLPGELDDRIRALGGEVHPVKLGLDFPWTFRRLLSAHQFDAVHSHVHYASGFVLRLAAMAKVPVRIAHFRSTEDGQGDSIRRRLQRKILKRWIDRYATHILAVCEGAMNASWGQDWAQDPRAQTVYNGLDLAAYHGPPDPEGVRREFNIPAGSVLCTHVGRFSPPKNHGRLLAIFAQVLRHTPGTYLVLVGGGSPDAESPIRDRASELGLADRVVFAGVRDDVPRLLLAADLMIFPSTWEGLPGAVLEACAAGLPVLASDLPGVQEIARFFPGVDCISLEESDQVWCDRALRLLASAGDPPGRPADRESGFARSPFSIERAVMAFEDTYCYRP